MLGVCKGSLNCVEKGLIGLFHGLVKGLLSRVWGLGSYRGCKGRLYSFLTRGCRRVSPESPTRSRHVCKLNNNLRPSLTEGMFFHRGIFGPLGSKDSEGFFRGLCCRIALQPRQPDSHWPLNPKTLNLKQP